MGQSTDAIICFGVPFEEDTEFPWDDDIESWWLYESGFISTFCPFTDDGDYKEGVDEKDPRISAFFAEQRAWEKTHPLPVDLVYHCSDGCPMYIVAAKGTELTAHRGYPEVFDPFGLLFSVNDDQQETLLAFIRKYELDKCFEHKLRAPEWYLCSVWS